MKVPRQAKPVFRIPVAVGKQVGLGDVIKRVTRKVGFDPCGGCERRAAVLNRWVAFTPLNNSNRGSGKP
jgi:hypothetical protein